jgi:hypothetical protein
VQMSTSVATASILRHDDGICVKLRCSLQVDCPSETTVLHSLRTAQIATHAFDAVSVHFALIT